MNIDGVDAMTFEEWATGPWVVLVFENLGVSEAISQLDGATIVLPTGTSQEVAVFDVFRDLNISYEPVPAATYGEAVQQFLAGAGDLLLVPRNKLDEIALDPRLTVMEEEITTAGTVQPFDAIIRTVGDTGTNSLAGTDGDDVIYALAGDDRIFATLGNDAIFGGDDVDLLDYSQIGDAVEVYLNLGITRGAGGRDSIQEIENIDGSAFADRLIGDASDNVLRGLSGNDLIKGKGGDDTLVGGAGDDILRSAEGDDEMIGGTGIDILLALGGDDMLSGGDQGDYLYGGRGADVLLGEFGGDFLRGNRDNDILSGSQGLDDLRGGGGNDMLDGGTDADFLFGGNGSDILQGGAGDDVLTGGVGGGVADGAVDTFIYNPYGFNGFPDGGYDRIKDFENGIDLLDLSAWDFDDFTQDVFSKSADTANGLRIKFAEGAVVFMEDFTRTEFDATDVIL